MWYTGTGKIAVCIIFQTVQYHNFAQFGISHAAVPSASHIAAHNFALAFQTTKYKF